LNKTEVRRRLKMVTGFEVLGAISSSYSFTKDIVAFFKGVHDAKTAIPNIMLRFEDDALLLEHLAACIDESILKNLDLESLSHLQRVISHILPIAQDVSVRLHRYKTNNIWDRAKWAVVGKDLKSSEEDIYDWIKRLQTCFVLFPTKAKTDIVSALGPNSKNAILIEAVTAQQRMESRISKFREIGYQQTKDLDPDLQLSTELSSTIELSSQARISTISGRQLLVEFKKLAPALVHSESAKQEMEEEVVKLVSVLSVVRPTDMFLLRTKYFFATNPKLNQPSVPFGILYEFPAKYSPPSRLIDLLRKTTPNGTRILEHSLDQRFELVRQISTAILFIHSVGWFHKGIRSSNLFLAHSKEATDHGRNYPEYLGTSFLAGFDYSRSEAARSTGDEAEGGWKRALYQHPERNITSDSGDPIPEYIAEHDIYSLGVTMVEIGRWKPLETYPQLFQNASPAKRKARLEDMAEGLRVTLGRRYVELTLRCLRILDEDSRPLLGVPAIRGIVLDLEELASSTK
jgi:hypothetical protein